MRRHQQVMLTSYGGPEALELSETSTRDPVAGEVRLKVLVAGVGYADVLMRRHHYPGAPPVPFVPGYEVVGVVDALGEGVEGFEVGQKVAAVTVTGGYAQYTCVAAHHLVPVADSLDDAEVAALVLNHLSAWQMLHRAARVGVGSHILVQGASGGVGTALVQLARLAGVEVMGTASPRHHGAVEAMGALPVDYRAVDLVARARDWSSGGVDAAFDAVGGSSLRRSFHCVRRGGILVSYGTSSSVGRPGPALLYYLALGLRLAAYHFGPTGRRATLYGVTTSRAKRPEWHGADLSELFRLLGERVLVPSIGTRLPLDQVRRAHDLLERGAAHGKILLLPHG